MSKIISPKEFFGFTPGDDYELAHWTKIVEYFNYLNEACDRVLVENMGPTTEGHPFLKVTFSSPENLANLDFNCTKRRRFLSSCFAPREKISAP